MKVYVATDHAGFELKERLVPFLVECGYKVIDVGAETYDKDDDYPLYIAKAAAQVARDKDARAIVLGASGQGEAMVANRFKGVRAVVFYGEPIKKQTDVKGEEQTIIGGSRVHNDANVLALGARFISFESAKDAVKKWLETPFSAEERHLRRIEMIDNILPS